MASRKCGVCNRPRDEDEMYVVHTTEKEREAIRTMGAVAHDSYAYCRPCWGVISDREKGAQLLKGQIQAKVQAAGVPTNVAETYASKLYAFLIKNSKPSS